jgi:filamentous hemagglutinin family protein
MLFRLATEKFYLFALTFILLPLPVKAQSISADGTTATDVTTTDNQNFNIDGGDRAGGNLFNSFGRFSVPTNGSANFKNPADVQNIINRVTGGSLSDIDGLIKASGGANLFLINPAGIIFGANARLDIGGSFLGSTADRLTFSDGTEFSATGTLAKPILTINAPIGLGFRNNPAAIVNRSTGSVNPTNNQFEGIKVKPGNNLTFAGGDINFNGGKVKAPGGNVSLGGLAAAGNLQINENGRLSFPQGIARSNVSFQGADVDVLVDSPAGNGGSIAIDANNLQILEKSVLRAGIRSGALADTRAGDIVLNATDTINISGGSDVQNTLATGVLGRGGDVNIRARNLNLSDPSSFLRTRTFSGGNAGNININASDRISIANNASLITSTINAAGKAGDINLNTNNMSLVNNALLGSTTLASRGVTTGNAGNVLMNVGNNLSIDGSLIINSVDRGNPTDRVDGSAGNIDIKTGSLNMTNKARIQNSTISIGNAGNIYIDANNSIDLSGNSRIFSTNVFGTGKVGNIKIGTNNLSLTDDSLLSNTNAFGASEPGNIEINARNSISLNKSNIVNGNVQGIDEEARSGGINIDTKNLFLANNARIFTNSTFGTGDAGDLNIKASDRISLDNSSIASSSVLGRGSGGNITISTNKLTLANNSDLVNSAAVTRGRAGNINVNANILTLNKSQIATSTRSGEGGNIDLQVGRTLGIQNNSQISAQANGNASGANLNINARSIVAAPAENNDIVARVGSGEGGKIAVSAENVYDFQGNSSVNSDRINEIDTNPSIGLAESRFLDVSNYPDVDFGKTNISIVQPIAPEEIIAQACSASGNPDNSDRTQNTFTIITKPKSGNPSSTEEIFPARGWRVNDKGQVELTRYPTPNVSEESQRALFSPINCP